MGLELGSSAWEAKTLTTRPLRSHEESNHKSHFVLESLHSRYSSKLGDQPVIDVVHYCLTQHTINREEQMVL